MQNKKENAAKGKAAESAILKCAKCGNDRIQIKHNFCVKCGNQLKENPVIIDFFSQKQ